MVNKYDHCQIYLVGRHFHIVTQGFTDNPQDWKRDIFFMRCEALDTAGLLGSWRLVEENENIYPDLKVARELSTIERSYYRRLKRLLHTSSPVDIHDLFSGCWSETDFRNATYYYFHVSYFYCLLSSLIPLLPTWSQVNINNR